MRYADDVHAIEADGRKVAFLRTAVRELGLSIMVHRARSEALQPAEADVVTARAVAPLVSLLPHLRRHLKPSGVGLLHKGTRVAYEIQEAEERWSFRYRALPSVTSGEGVILCVAGIEDRKAG